MKEKPKHTSVQRLYWKTAQRRWRAAHLERAERIRKRYWRKRRSGHPDSDKTKMQAGKREDETEQGIARANGSEGKSEARKK